ncbi:MAG: CinA family nicotinamide mononucleotide deamidase-related protein [Deltaproteobacteria bacterium]|nr:CinA family nicotinamide mononucleotide deamidase-related protein [Deltaproteobacteria bacterium]
MIAEILSTGDEIRTGGVADTNSAYIARLLQDAGIFVARHNCIGDDINDIAAIIKEISERADIVIATGGLGPTEDDITAEAVAKAANVKLALNITAYKRIEEFLKQLGKKKITPLNAKQALLPQNSILINNFTGTASGFLLKINKAVFFFLPGVPFEMKGMMPQVIEYIQKELSASRRFNKTINIKTLGVPESSANEALKDFSKEFKNIKLGFRAVLPEIHVKLYGSGDDKETIERELKKGEQFVIKRLGEYVFSTDGKSIEETIAEILIKKRASLSIAESCTGGLIASRLTDVAGSSEYFLFSGVTYANDSKIKVLKVSPATIEKYGAVSVETVQEMAAGAKRISGADYAIAVSGIAGPSGGTKEKPVGTVCIGIADLKTVTGKMYNFPFKERIMNKEIFAAAALWLLLKRIRDV